MINTNTLGLFSRTICKKVMEKGFSINYMIGGTKISLKSERCQQKNYQYDQQKQWN